MSNFKSPLVSIATFWISKTARDLVANRSASFSAGAICIDWETTDLQLALSKSQLLSSCWDGVCPPDVIMVRFACSFTRDGLTFFVRSWVLYSIRAVAAPGSERIGMGRVSEVVEVVQPDSIQLLFCLDEHPLPSTDPDRGDVMFAPADMWESKGSHVYILSPVMELSLLHVTMSADQREVCVQEVH